MDRFDKTKAVVIAVFTALSGWLGLLAVPMYLLVLLNIADYFTGVCAANYRGEAVSSYKGIWGIAKKICMWLLVAVGAALDWLLMYATDTIGVEIPFAFLVASLVAVWLICNEMISILENVADIGVKLPPFLMPLVEKIKGAAEQKAKQKKEEEKDNAKHLD